MKVLVTCFDPFGGETVNSAQKAIDLLPSRVHFTRIITAQIPTKYDASVDEIKRLLTIHNPDALLMVGQAAGRTQPELERIGINWDSASTADNSGETRLNQKICEDGPDGLFSTMPIEKMVSACRENGFPCNISYSAGTFVCNHVLYSMLNYASDNQLPMKIGFLHLPATMEQALAKKYPFMESRTAAAVIKVLISAIDE
ncbi:MAG TPA: pyroglutamyl-peptidase I [Oscillospiraceae bacterium]|nr:pyroglutamyl-peptidase I [Oscillospiraceae bacterium]HPF55207.1 pyroglutamyl-peptidase I [Clostridiales bacterium]HPK36409.1 pyroglutamyl-peptidase I [Oscillospiraceae bacterium]HPR76855.1 pyroglutamyl-peptidase I [Oscillospiraceae bacterium]